ncbi:MAG: glutathione peroxidase [Betaproteobacteria bacterium]|jgi:glutathione peroxidase
MLPNIPLNRLNGSSENLQDYSNKVLLIVNVASACGFTPQYKDLQALYAEKKTLGLEIMGFPCNQFGSQEPGSAEEIAEFCSSKFHVTFPMFEKIDVNGPQTHPLYNHLKQSAPGLLGTEGIKWNFTKFLLSRDGTVIKRYGSADSIQKIKTEIEGLLNS